MTKELVPVLNGVREELAGVHEMLGQLKEAAPDSMLETLNEAQASLGKADELAVQSEENLQKTLDAEERIDKVNRSLTLKIILLGAFVATMFVALFLYIQQGREISRDTNASANSAERAAKNVEALQATFKDCIVPEGQCFKDSQGRSAGIVQGLIALIAADSDEQSNVFLQLHDEQRQRDCLLMRERGITFDPSLCDPVPTLPTTTTGTTAPRR